MVTSDILTMLLEREEKERNHKRICDDFHAATTFENWKDGKNSDESL
jgi:hypothetical protein